MAEQSLHSRTYRWWVLFTVSLGALNVSLDSSILVVCYPALANIFHTDSSVIGWINVAYLMMSQSIGVTLAKVGDAKGRKMVYLLGLGFYGLGMLACTFSQGPLQLIFSRALQGVGAATGWSLTTAIVVAVFPTTERGRALGILAGVYSVGLVAGTVIGGIILDLLGWRGVFYARIPLVLAALVMGWVVIEEQRGQGEFEFDFRGFLSLLICVSTFMFFLNFGGKWGFRSPFVVLMGLLATLFLVLFSVIEARASHPVVDLSLFKKRRFSAAVFGGGLQNAAAATAIFTLPFYLSEALDYSASTVGVFLAVLAVPLALVSPISGRLSDRFSPRLLSAFGMLVLFLALLALRRLGVRPTYFETMLAVIFLGTGMAIFQSPNNSALMGAVAQDKLGTASAILSTIRNVGSSSAIAVASSVFSVRQTFHFGQLYSVVSDPAVAKRMASAIGFGDTLIIGIVIAFIGIFTTLVPDRKEKGRRQL